VQINYVAGGGAANLPVRVSALVRNKYLNFPDYDAFSFSPPRGKQATSNEGEEDSSAADSPRVVADKLPLNLDRTGAGKITIESLPADMLAKQPKELLLEATYADPNGEVQTLRGTSTLWPAGVVAGIKTEGWVSLSGGSSQKVRFQALALDLNGKPKADVPLEVQAVSRTVTTTRKRMVGGFYTYDNQTTVKALGKVCSGKSDARGLLLCETPLSEAGEVELVVTAKDGAGNSSQAASSVYVTRQGELWFGGENHDRMDLLAEKKSYQPGETAKFQVRMPFRFATALVAVEREGIIETQVVQLNGQDPTISLKVQGQLGPERLRECAGLARPAARGAVVQLLQLGLQGAARMVDGLLVRRPRIRGADRAGRPEQARVPPGHGRDPRRHQGPPARCESDGRQGQLPGARPGARDHQRQAAERPARRRRRSGAGRRGPGAAGADAQHQLEPARCDAAAPRLGRADGHGADGNHRPPTFRPQGRAGRWRWWPWQHTRTARHPAAVEPETGARRARPGGCHRAAERRAHHLQDRRRGRCLDRPVRHRPDQCADHAGLADHQRPAAAGARRRRVPRADHAAQHHAEGHEGAGLAARHAADHGAADGGHSRRRSARSGLDGDRAGPAGPDPRAEAILWEIEAKDTLGEARATA
jgi:hypothetical protein